MIKKILGSTDSWMTVPLRIVLGIIFLAHGGQKLFGWFGGPGLEATARGFAEHLGMNPGWLWASLAGGGEFFGGLLVLLGLVTRFGALNLSIVMTVAILTAHRQAFFLTNHGMEYALALLGASLALLIGGGGPLSADAAIVKGLNHETR